MRLLVRKIRTVLWSAVLAFVILAFGQIIWGGLLLENLRSNPAIPWAVPAMALVLWTMWNYLGGSWWPQRTSAIRRQSLRAFLVPREAFVWTLVAGLLAVAALAGYWIVLFQLVRMSPNAIPDFSKYPIWTSASAIAMSSLVSPLIEEAAFRGYCQALLEREFRSYAPVVISSILFTLAHLTHGFFWPKLLVYFLVGLVFGVPAFLTKSILPALPVHIAGDVVFFTLVWPHDAARRLVADAGMDKWFWIHVAQALIFTILAILAFLRLARATDKAEAIASQPENSGPNPLASAKVP